MLMGLLIVDAGVSCYINLRMWLKNPPNKSWWPSSFIVPFLSQVRYAIDPGLQFSDVQSQNARKNTHNNSVWGFPVSS
jgi:hypothetical protein